ncbi:related to AUR1-inositol phosphorylceramide synthase [Ustilago bromivora]|uniref:Related to AUR1 - inositol phosphorylceramide synthase n=1 Tax=Ustilago bromivora TaxID=307758 RepID=A0A1K0H165_9BASI|nr:related to AUR1-inositol phosphorylceramide synthase [Ustilago bromivora]SYW77851.1 related to AUR1 - inositol phosphorylceramide synthase [Ustilago bromivora]
MAVACSSSTAGAPNSAPTAVFQLSPKARLCLPSWLHYLLSRILAAGSRLNLSTSVPENLGRFRAWSPSKGERFKYAFLLLIALFSLFVMESPALPYKLIIPALYATTLLFPVSSQFFLPAAPIFAWLILFYSCKSIPAAWRPHIWVSVLPTLETIWYGANISDILTQFGHPILDLLAWLPYGVIHFAAPFFVASFLFVFAPPGSVKVFAQAFGFMMLLGVMIQILFPCAPPWYELREGLVPANYGMRGSPAGLARIDALFHSHGYTLTFTGAPVVFGAFPSLHAGNATMKALFCSYFFPIVVKIGRLRIDARIFYWTYCSFLYWSTMYLMHHYLIDLVAGACLATACFYTFLTDEMRDAMEKNYPYRNSDAAPPSAAPPSNRPDQAFASTGTAGQGSIALDTMRSNGGAPYITAQGGVNGDVESQKRPELIFSIDREEGGDIAGSTVEEERRKKDAAALLARTKSPVQRVRTPAGNKRDNDNA